MLLITQGPKMEPECSVQAEKTPIHPQFNDSEADVTFQSVDGILFNLRRKYLELNTGAFPGAEFDTRGEVTHLTETSKVLEVLFRFVYPKEQPDVEELSFITLAGVAEAAEKYEVYAAMNICKLQMKRFLPQDALGILAHASKHDYPKLIQEAVPHLGRVSMVTVLEVLPPRYVLPFVRYHESWNSVFEDALKAIIEMKVASPSNPRQHWYFERSLKPQACHSCMMFLVVLLQELKALESVKDLKEALSKTRPALSSCISPACRYSSVCTTIFSDMKTKLEGIPPFLDFL